MVAVLQTQKRRGVAAAAARVLALLLLLGAGCAVRQAPAPRAAAAGPRAPGAPPPESAPSPVAPAAPPAPPAAGPLLASSEFCRVYGTGDRRRAARVCAAVSAVCREFQANGWPMPPRAVDVFLYRRWEEFAQAVGAEQLSPQYEGMANVLRGALYLFHEWQTDGRLLEIARHETTHLLLHENGGFRIPARFQPPPGQEMLPSVPWWLEEGLASCMEAADSRGPTAGLNRGRCRDLQALIRAGRCPPVHLVIAKPFGAGSAADYAVAWGVLYEVLFPAPPATHAEGLARLHRYLDACRNGFLAEPETDFARRFFAADGRLRADFRQAWDEHIARESILAFQRILLPSGLGLEAWESRWRARMLSLDATQPSAP